MTSANEKIRMSNMKCILLLTGKNMVYLISILTISGHCEPLDTTTYSPIYLPFSNCSFFVFQSPRRPHTVATITIGYELKVS